MVPAVKASTKDCWFQVLSPCKYSYYCSRARVLCPLSKGWLQLNRCMWLGQQAVALFLCGSFSSLQPVAYLPAGAIFFGWDCKVCWCWTRMWAYSNLSCLTTCSLVVTHLTQLEESDVQIEAGQTNRPVQMSVWKWDDFFKWLFFSTD